MFRSKRYDSFMKAVSFCRCGFSDSVIPDLGLDFEERKTVAELKERLKLFIDKYKLREVDNPKKAKITCILYSEFPDSEGYDIVGCTCFKGNKKMISITYSGYGGDVNKLYLTEKNSLTIYVK